MSGGKLGADWKFTSDHRMLSLERGVGVHSRRFLSSSL